MSDKSGFVVIDKPAGITSHDVVARLRRTLATKRVGHAGTLDPMATGVLVLGINNGTKFLNFITDGKKRYLATIRLGVSTTTDDREGELISKRDTSQVTDDQIRSTLNAFVGKIMQKPSSVSAIKVKGERAYDLVRRGEKVDLPAREVEIFFLEVTAIHRGEYLDIDIDVSCSAGTYIRAIARDLGEQLDVGGHLISLRRTEVSPFKLDDVTAIDNPELRPLLRALDPILPSRLVDESEVTELRFGRVINRSPFEGPGIAFTTNGEVVAIIENREYGAQPITVFNS